MSENRTISKDIFTTEHTDNTELFCSFRLFSVFRGSFFSLDRCARLAGGDVGLLVIIEVFAKRVKHG